MCYSAPPPLMAASLQSMVDQGLLSTTRQEECQQLQRKALSEEVNCVFPIFWENQRPPERFIHFSVFTGEHDSWCHFGRTRVYFDTHKGQWHCQCQNKTKQCSHRCVCKWWLFQERPQLLRDTDPTTDVEEAQEIEELLQESVLA